MTDKKTPPDWVLIIRPDGKIELGAGADPTEAAAQCIEAMSGMMQTMIDNAVKAREALIMKWLRKHGMRQTAMMLGKGDHLK
jgi:hypothetical protein